MNMLPPIWNKAKISQKGTQVDNCLGTVRKSILVDPKQAL